MADCHYVHKDVEGASSQWDDIQRKLGNLPPKPTAFKLLAFYPTKDEDTKPNEKIWIDSKNDHELEDLEDELDNERFLEEYRRKRLAELKEAAKVAKFGSILPIFGSISFGKFLRLRRRFGWCFQECELLMNCLEELARRYPATKFVKIVSTDCIPNYPDHNLLTLLVYDNISVKANYVGLRSFGRRCTPEGVALVLCQSDPVLNHGLIGNESSREAVLDEVRRKLVEKVVTENENHDDDGFSSD